MHASTHSPTTLPATQGGRWLESSTVEHEGARGYGALHHHPQQGMPEVAYMRPVALRLLLCCLLRLCDGAAALVLGTAGDVAELLPTPVPSICKRAGAGCAGWAEVSGVCGSR